MTLSVNVHLCVCASAAAPCCLFCKAPALARCPRGRHAAAEREGVMAGLPMMPVPPVSIPISRIWVQTLERLGGGPLKHGTHLENLVTFGDADPSQFLVMWGSCATLWGALSTRSACVPQPPARHWTSTPAYLQPVHLRSFSLLRSVFRLAQPLVKILFQRGEIVLSRRTPRNSAP